MLQCNCYLWLNCSNGSRVSSFGIVNMCSIHRGFMWPLALCFNNSSPFTWHTIDFESCEVTKDPTQTIRHDMKWLEIFWDISYAMSESIPWCRNGRPRGLEFTGCNISHARLIFMVTRWFSHLLLLWYATSTILTYTKHTLATCLVFHKDVLVQTQNGRETSRYLGQSWNSSVVCMH